MRRRQQSERGAALVAVAVFLAALLALTVVGIDVGRLAHVATEVQSAADAAASAGALGLRDARGAASAGITRAHVVSRLNFMNGAAASDADVLVDEGYYNGNTNPPTFLYCTRNTPCALNGYWGIQSSPVLTCSSATAAGRDCTNRVAALAIPHTTVNNLFAGIFDFFQNGRIASAANGTGNAQSVVEKAAVAMYGGPGTGCTPPPGCGANDWACYCQHNAAPCLPIAAPSCDFPSACFEGSCTTTLKVSNSTNDTAAWTSFETSPTSDNSVAGFLNQGPCGKNNGGSVPGTQSVPTVINNNNGLNGASQNQPYGLVACVAGLPPSSNTTPYGCTADANGNITGSGGRVFTIPIFDLQSPTCSHNLQGNYPIVGFATVQITSVNISGSTKEINIVTLSHQDTGATSTGGQCFGTDCRVVLAR